MSGITGISWVTSAFANGACTDLDAKRKATTEAQINLKLHKINTIKSKTLRRLLREEKLTGPAIAEAHQMIAQEEADTRNNATTDELVRHLMQHMYLHPEGTDELGELEAEDPYELIVSQLQSLKSPSEAVAADAGKDAHDSRQGARQEDARQVLQPCQDAGGVFDIL